MQFNLNVTPYVKFGQKNEIILAGRRHIVPAGHAPPAAHDW